MLLQDKFEIPAVIGPTPIGIENTDRFVMNVSELAGVAIPKELEDERGRLVDMMTDAHPHFHGKRVAVFGDPDIVSGAVSMLVGMGMEPTIALTGTPDKQFKNEIKGIATECDAVIGDLFLFHQLIKRDPVDLLIGNSFGKYIARAEDIPILRMGFPIMDRANLHYFPIMGYAGAARLVEQIGNILLDRKDRDADEAHFELVL